LTGLRLSREEAARLLRQKAELGPEALYLTGLSRGEALRLAAAARAGAQALVSSATQTQPVPATDTPTGRDHQAPTRQAVAAATSSLPVLPASYIELREHALSCTRCRLSEGRTKVVFSDGVEHARVMVVGEAPGASEDETGVPFVGAAGKYLNLLLSTVGLSREDTVYIANVLKCRPPGNRDPMPDEIEACSPFLLKQIELVQPEVLLAVGSFSAQLLTGLGKVALGKIRGEVHSYRGVPLVVTYHPAALLRNPKWTRPFWDDLQLLRQVLDGA